MSDFKLPISGTDFVRPDDEVTVSFGWSVAKRKTAEVAR
jgi:hypothetical protein